MKKIKYIILFINLPLILIIVEICSRIIWDNYWECNNRNIKIREYIPNISRTYNTFLISKKTKRVNPNYINVRSNSDGFLLPDFFSANSKDTMKIAFLGDSRTACSWLKENNRFPCLVSKWFVNNRYVNVKLLNAGVDGSDIKASINLYFNKLLKYQPDIVILFHSLDDEFIAKTYLESINNRKRFEIILDMLSGTSNLAGLIRHFNAQEKVQNENSKIAINKIEKYSEEKNSILKKIPNKTPFHRILVSMLNEFEIKPLLLPDVVFSSSSNRLDMKKKYKQWLTGLKYDFIDWTYDFDSTDTYDGVHFTDKGSKKAANLIITKLRENEDIDNY